MLSFWLRRGRSWPPSTGAFPFAADFVRSHPHRSHPVALLVATHARAAARAFEPCGRLVEDFNLATTRRTSSGIGDGHPPTGKDLSRPHAPSGIPGSIESPNRLSHEHVDFEWSTCDSRPSLPPVLHRCLAPRRHGEVVDRKGGLELFLIKANRSVLI